MTPFRDPAFEIKSALDREVARTFDPAPLVEALRSGGPPEVERLAGPLARLPVPVQWIAVVAAVIAAITGLRSVYLDVTTRDDRIAFESRRSAEPLRPERAHEREAAPSSPSPPVRAPEPTTPPRESRPPRADPPAGANTPIGGSIVPVPATPPGEVVAQAIPDSREPAPAPGVVAATDEPPRKVKPGPAPVVAAVQPQFGVLPAGIVAAGRGVKLLDLSLFGRPLEATVRDLPEVGVTLVAVAPVRGRLPSRRAAAEAAGRNAASGTEDTPSAAPASSGDYYVRMLAGGSFDRDHEEYTLTGKDVRIVPLREREVWGTEAHRLFLERAFGVEAVVATGGALVGPASGEIESTLEASLGGVSYRVTVHGSRGEPRNAHQIEVTLSRVSPRPSRRTESMEVAASFLIETGRIVVLAVPDPLVPGDSPTATDAGSTVFLVLSPRFDDFRVSDDLIVSDHPAEAPVLIDGPEPRYPDEARELQAAGRVLLRAVVREDGSIDGVEVLTAPDVPGAKYLVAAAVRAVRQWRYLPARHEGRLVPALVTIVLDFTPRGG